MEEIEVEDEEEEQKSESSEDVPLAATKAKKKAQVSTQVSVYSMNLFDLPNQLTLKLPDRPYRSLVIDGVVVNDLPTALKLY